jgi:hypothetical protein
MQIWKIYVTLKLILVLQNMDEIYETFGSVSEKGSGLELETNAILRQALDPTLKSKFYINRASIDPIDKEVRMTEN